MMRKLVRKLMMLDPGYRKAFFLEQKLDRMCDELKTVIEAAKPIDRTDEIKVAITRSNIIAGDRYNSLLHRISSLHKDQGAIVGVDAVREALRTKWALVDRFLPEPVEAKCPVCGSKFKIADVKKLESEDVWGGGHLTRYLCPQCGLIFGPIKMLSLSDQELAEDYKVHYSVYSEGDCTEQEKRVFLKLHPSKGRKYLNWGCGAWSRTIEELRADGYDVYGYEPFANVDSPYIYNSMEKMRGCKFDGIFSHDLLEHVVDPVSFFNDNVSLLTDDGLIVHSTACFEYVYAYTRFHLYFYTGDSINEICRRVGLVQVAKDIDDVNLQIDVTFKKG